MLPWATPSTAQVNSRIKSFEMGLWSRYDQVWVYFLKPNTEKDSTLTTSTFYIPPDNIAPRSLFLKESWLRFYDNNRSRWVLVKDITNNPTETEMWRKLLIKAKYGGYQYIYDFLEEVICRTYGESAPLVMNDLYNEIMSAFVYHGQFPTSSRGVWYCLQEYTRLKRAGKVPINDPEGEARLIEGGRPHFRLPLIPRSLFYRMQD